MGKTGKALLDQLNTVVVGKPAQVRDSVACLLAGGHLLLEDVPGVGKTTLAHALAHSFGLQGLTQRLVEEQQAGGPEYSQIDTDTSINSHTFSAALHAAGAALAATARGIGGCGPCRGPAAPWRRRRAGWCRRTGRRCA